MRKIPSMRSLKYAVVVIFCCLAVLGCYEVNEEISINDDGSGVYNMKMDMGQLLEMMQTFAGEEKMQEEGLDKAIDTTFIIGKMLDSAKDMTPEQKALLKDGKMHLEMNVKEKIFKIDLNVPYKNYASLAKLLAGEGSTGGAISKAVKGLFGGAGDSAQPDEPTNHDFDDFSNVYDVKVDKGLISRRVNADKVKALAEQPGMEQMKQLSSSGMEILYTTTIRLPRPVKKSDNPNFKFSDDKKTVTMKYNLLDMFDNPEKFSYTIEY